MKPNSLIGIIIPIIILASLFCSTTLMAQDQSDTTEYIIETLEGNEFRGKIVYEDAEIIRLQTQKYGTIDIRKDNIRRRERILPKNLVEGEYWPENPQETRYFWSPSGYGLKKGEGYYQNTWIFFNQVSYGVSDNFSMGAGIMPLFLLGGAPTPVWANLKFSIPVSENKFNVGAGGLFGTVLGEEQASFGILYGLTTFGDRDRNLSVGVGWGYAGEGLSSSPTVTISGMFRTGKKGYLLTENYIFPIDGEVVGLVSFGARSMLGKAGLDYGLFIPVGDVGELVAIPWLGLIIPFGNSPVRN